ncbi:MAG: glycosyltransferase family 2 protein [Candidatus Firestonebacteria bacterium]
MNNNYIEDLVSIIIPNYNGEKYLSDCLASLRMQNYKEREIIIVDDCSIDDSVEIIKKYFPEVKILRNDKNYGFAKTVNNGIQFARGKYIALLNNDTKVVSNWLSDLVREIKRNDNIGMCASKILFLNNTNLIDSVGVVLYPDGMSRTRGHQEKDIGQYDQVEEVLLPSGCSALYRRDALDYVGLLDEDFISYCEDTDLGLRVRLAGWKAVLVPTAITYHSYSRASNKYSEYKAFLVERNHLWIAIKYFPLKMLILVPFYKIWRYIIQIYAILLNKGSGFRFLEDNTKLKLVIILIKSNIASIKGIPNMIIKRKEFFKKKKILNKEFIKIVNKYKISAKELIFKD